MDKTELPSKYWKKREHSTREIKLVSDRISLPHYRKMKGKLSRVKYMRKRVENYHFASGYWTESSCRRNKPFLVDICTARREKCQPAHITRLCTSSSRQPVAIICPPGKLSTYQLYANWTLVEHNDEGPGNCSTLQPMPIVQLATERGALSS